ncbi:MAG: TspO/MBR family protein [Parcubacteria group bacterium]
MKSKITLLLFSLAVSLLAGSLGSFFTQSSVSSWYLNLSKPVFNPPSYLFAPVWTFLFILIGVSLYLVLVSKAEKKIKNKAYILFAIQWLLNIGWSFCFFYLRNPLLGFIEIIMLLLAIILTTFYFYKINKVAAYLLIPYILWVSFASILNFSIWFLN